MKLLLVLAIIVVLGNAQTNGQLRKMCLHSKPDCYCLQYEDPVCATNGCTYGNLCKLECSEAILKHEGPCKRYK